MENSIANIQLCMIWGIICKCYISEDKNAVGQTNSLLNKLGSMELCEYFLQVIGRISTSDISLYRLEDKYGELLNNLKTDDHKSNAFLYGVSIIVGNIKCKLDLCTNVASKNLKKSMTKFDDLNKQRSTLTGIYKKLNLEIKG